MSMKKLPSRITVEGLDRAPHRAFLHALGVTGADLKKPFIGVASTDRRVFQHYAEAVALATEMKQYTKGSATSSWAMDRRSGQ